MNNRPWFPPNSLTGLTHWRVETLRLDGSFRTYTEHETKDQAIRQLGRMVERYPSHQLRLTHVVGKI